MLPIIRFWINLIKRQLNIHSLFNHNEYKAQHVPVSEGCMKSSWINTNPTSLFHGWCPFVFWDIPCVRHFWREPSENNQKYFTLIAYSHLFLHSNWRAGSRGARRGE